MTRILIVADTCDTAKGGVPAFNQQFAVHAAEAGREVYMLVAAAGKEEKPEDVARTLPGVHVALVPNPVPAKEVQKGLLPLLLEDFVQHTPPGQVPKVPTVCWNGTAFAKGTLPRGTAKEGPAVVIGHSRFSGMAPGSIVKGPRNSIQDRHRPDDAWYPHAKYIHFVHMEIELLGEVKEALPPEIFWDVMRETFCLVDADVIACAGRGVFEWVHRYRDYSKVTLPGMPITARLHELVPGADITTPAPPFPAPKPDEPLRLILLGRADDATKNAMGACRAVRFMTSDKEPPPEPHPAHLTLQGMPKEKVDAYQKDVDRETRPLKEGSANRVATVNPYVPRDQIPQKIAEAHAVIIPSLSEAFALVSFEALQASRPALTTYNNGFARFLLDPDHVPLKLGEPFVVQDRGLKGAARDDVWTKALKNLKTDFTQLTTKAQTIRNILQGYSWAHCAEAVLAAAHHQPHEDTKQISGGKIKTAAPPPDPSPGQDPWEDHGEL
ncbi:hypothetical protein [Streptomyces griseus]|uniref:hypothetical protein n=1 Tax=Streptomyces griseus TaxID=1911 RepID=UPI0033B2ABE0